MKNKVILVILCLLFALTTTCSVVGFVKHKNTTISVAKEKVVFEYYLEEELVEKMPTNQLLKDENGTEYLDKVYSFEKASCTDEVKGQWNEKDWKYEIEKDNTGTCKLFFVKSKYAVSFTIEHGTASANNKEYISRLEDGKFVITPETGYKFDKITCNNNKIATFDEKTNTVTIPAVSSDVACQIEFEISSLKVTLNVVHGEGSITSAGHYGSSFTTIVKPEDESYTYEDGNIVCTNDQEGVWSLNSFSIPNLTSETECTLTFTRVAIKAYTLKLIDIPADLNFINGGPNEKGEITVNANETTQFEIDTYKKEKLYDLSCYGTQTTKKKVGKKYVNETKQVEFIPTVTPNEDANKITYAFTNPTSDITCTFKEKILTE